MKYTTEIDRGLLRITAAKTFATPDGQIIHKGQQGGLIQCPDNLSQHGTCWIFPDAKAIEGAQVMHGAILTGNTTASGAALITDRATAYDSNIDGQAVVTNSAYVAQCTITQRARVQGNANARQTTITEDATLGGKPIETRPMPDACPRLLAAIMQQNPTAPQSRITPQEKALLERIRQHIRIKRPRAYDMGAYRLIDATNIQILFT